MAKIVLIASAIAVLLLFSNYIVSTGRAYSTVVHEDGVKDILNHAVTISDSGKTKCNIKCRQAGKECILAYAGSELTTCKAKITGAHTCVCASPEILVGEVPS